MKTATCNICNEDVPVTNFAHIALYKHGANKHGIIKVGGKKPPNAPAIPKAISKIPKPPSGSGVKKNGSTKVQKKTSSD